MELWIRTQHKMALIKSSGVYFKEEHNDFTDGSKIKWYFYDCSSNEVIASYDRKERCIEILDEIQKIITDSNKTLVTLENELDVRDYDELLYELEKGKIAFVNNAQNAQVFPLQANIVYEMPEK